MILRYATTNVAVNLRDSIQRRRVSLARLDVPHQMNQLIKSITVKSPPSLPSKAEGDVSVSLERPKSPIFSLLGHRKKIASPAPATPISPTLSVTTTPANEPKKKLSNSDSRLPTKLKIDWKFADYTPTIVMTL